MEQSNSVRLGTESPESPAPVVDRTPGPGATPGMSDCLLDPGSREAPYHLHTLHQGQPDGLVPREADDTRRGVGGGLHQSHHRLHPQLTALERHTRNNMGKHGMVSRITLCYVLSYVLCVVRGIHLPRGAGMCF